MASIKLANLSKPPSLNAWVPFYWGVGRFDGFANSVSLAAFAGDAYGVNDDTVPGCATGAHRCRALSALYRAPGIRGRYRVAAATGRGPECIAN
ncbi:hypothetical protein EMIT0P258_80267 [Pseudomonas sp. IT-P258]